MKRRDFIRSTATIGATSLLPPFSLSTANAAEIGGYRALVCVFLYGGNDSHNTIVPLDNAEYAAYSVARNGLAEMNGLALPKASLLPITPDGYAANSFGLHPALTNLQQIFNVDRKLAIVNNVGPMLAPTTLAQYQTQAVPVPPQLFSHSDMQVHWQTMRPDFPADSGWGGRLADVLRSAATGQLPILTTLGNGNTFVKGNIVAPYQVTPIRYNGNAVATNAGIAQIPFADLAYGVRGNGNLVPQDLFVNGAMQARSNLLERQYAGLIKSSIDIGEYVTSAIYNVSNGQYFLKNTVPGTWPTANPLAAQLHSVAAMIAARAELGTSRQVFFVSLGGFDNHGDQFGRDVITGNKSLLNGKHFSLLKLVDEALSVFYRSTAAMGIANNVTTMTMSDFGRTMRSNGGGSDHGWGGHYFVMGGAVKGGRMIGAASPGATAASNYFPMPQQLAQFDVGEGRLLPTIPSDAYVATLARWMGVSDAGEMAQVLPNLSRFNIQNLDLMV